jgi:hypothetical protein
VKNLTIALDDELHRQSRLRAAGAGLSMSRYIAALVEKDVSADTSNADDDRRRQLEALQRVFDAPRLKISENGRMPTAEERNARR